MARIILSKSFGGFQARFDDEHHIYASGRTPDEAVGNLVLSFKSRFNVEIGWNNDKETQQYASKRLLIKTTP